MRTEIVATSIKASVKDTDKILFLEARWINADSIEEINEKQLIGCIQKSCLRHENGEK